jgi:hypothetical protein
VVWHFIGRMSPTSFAHQTRHLLAANFTINSHSSEHTTQHEEQSSQEQPRRHRGDLRDLRIVRRPRRATKRGHIAAGTKNARSSQGAVATTTSQRPARREALFSLDRRRLVGGRYFVYPSCLVVLSCLSSFFASMARSALSAFVAFASLTFVADQSTSTTPAAQPAPTPAPATPGTALSNLHFPYTALPYQAMPDNTACGPQSGYNLCNEHKHNAAGTKNTRSSHGAAATTSQRLARCASTPPNVRARAHRSGHEGHAELLGSSHDDDDDDIAADMKDAQSSQGAATTTKTTSGRTRRTRGAPREQPRRR